ncbi:MAG: hypothetical protein CMI12_03810 [Oceanospirillum sp.]|nr:hypothetical protein [Oceanospirillum sp.]
MPIGNAETIGTTEAIGTGVQIARAIICGTILTNSLRVKLHIRYLLCCSKYFWELVGPSKVDFLEPIWKTVLSNKALLPMLWQMFLYHPNLLPA